MIWSASESVSSWKSMLMEPAGSVIEASRAWASSMDM